MKKLSIIQAAEWLWRMIRYNLKVVFAGRFIWFMLASLGFFILITLITLFSGEPISTQSIYSLILFPGLLLVFYPTVFGIQNDEDMRIIEILFGIPDYRYKVWLFRLILIFVVVFLILWILAALCSWVLYPLTPSYMAYQLIFPIFFMGALAFLLSTVIRNGIGTAVVMVIIGVFFLILSDAVQNSQWNIFLNPFRTPEDMSETAWQSVIHDNRIILLVGTILAMLGGLMSLQRREKFI